MKITLNNRKEDIPAESPVTVKELLAIRKMSFRMFLVKINGVLIHKDKYSDTFISDGDEVQILYLMSGG